MGKMPRIIVQNATVLTLDEADNCYYPGFVEIREGEIHGLGAWSRNHETSTYAGETVILDGTEKLVMPGLVDLHFHTSVAKVRVVHSLVFFCLLMAFPMERWYHNIIVSVLS